MSLSHILAAAEPVASPFTLWRTIGLIALFFAYLLQRFVSKRRADRGGDFAFSWLPKAFMWLIGLILVTVVFSDFRQAGPMLPPHIWQNIIALTVLALVLFGLYLVLRHPFWGRRSISILKNPFVLISFLLVVFFAGTAFIDSISWIDSEKKRTSNALQAQQPRTILDRLFKTVVSTPFFKQADQDSQSDDENSSDGEEKDQTGVYEWEFKEKSHSAPFASYQFGKPESDTTKLKYKHILGTTIDGGDTLYQVLKGCKPAIVVGTLPLLISIPLALFFGVLGGFYGGKIDDFVVYVYSTLASIPSLLLLFAIIIAFGTGIFQVCVGLGVAGWVGLCRLSRGETLKLRELEYVQAAKCLGVSDAKILMRHIIPNLMHIVIITAILAFTGLVLSEAVLSYLGIGLDNSWGGLINNSRNEISRQPAIWWNLVFASAALFLLVLAVNVIGDALRDALDPRVSVGD